MTLLAPRTGNDDSYVMLYFVVVENVSLFHLVSWIPLRGCVCCFLLTYGTQVFCKSLHALFTYKRTTLSYRVDLGRGTPVAAPCLPGK